MIRRPIPPSDPLRQSNPSYQAAWGIGLSVAFVGLALTFLFKDLEARQNRLFVFLLFAAAIAFAVLAHLPPKISLNKKLLLAVSILTPLILFFGALFLNNRMSSVSFAAKPTGTDQNSAAQTQYLFDENVTPEPGSFKDAARLGALSGPEQLEPPTPEPYETIFSQPASQTATRVDSGQISARSPANQRPPESSQSPESESEFPPERRSLPVSMPKPGLAIVVVDQEGNEQFETAMLLLAHTRAERALELTKAELIAKMKNSSTWALDLPSSILLVEASSLTERAGVGRFRSEVVLQATFFMFPSTRQPYHARAFGAGFSSSEALTNGREKAVENLTETLPK